MGTHWIMIILVTSRFRHVYLTGAWGCNGFLLALLKLPIRKSRILRPQANDKQNIRRVTEWATPCHGPRNL